MPLAISVGDGSSHEVEVVRRGEEAALTIDGREYRGRLAAAGGPSVLTLDDRTEEVWVAVDGDTVYVHALGRAWTVLIVDPVEQAARGAHSTDVATAPMPGTVIAVPVAAGQAVTHGQPLVIIESMKMQSEIVALRGGVVERVFLEVGDTFERGAPLVSLVPAPPDDDEA